MRPLHTLAFFIAITLAPSALAPALAQTPSHQNGSTQAILAVLNKSVDDWNRGDIDAFVTCYKNSPSILFIGPIIKHGYAETLARYKSTYSTREKMGKVSFSQLATQPLDENFATVTGHYHLQRTPAGGGDASGFFLLVMEHTPAGWKIVRDDTTALPARLPMPAP